MLQKKRSEILSSLPTGKELSPSSFLIPWHCSIGNWAAGTVNGVELTWECLCSGRGTLLRGERAPVTSVLPIGRQHEGSGLTGPGVNARSRVFCLLLVNKAMPSACCTSGSKPSRLQQLALNWTNAPTTALHLGIATQRFSFALR